MIGLPKQTKASIRRDIEFSKKLLTKYGNRGVTAIVSPMVTLDPGSIVADHPDKYGFKLHGNSLSDSEKLFSAHYWKYRMNYETKWLSREDVFQLSLDAVLEITKTKNDLGLVPDSMLKKVEFEVNASRELAKTIDGDLDKKGKLTKKTREKIITENRRRQKDNSCIIYSMETALDTKWYHYKHTDEF
jgi:clorobiocin biosynthesis protein CloN6